MFNKYGAILFMIIWLPVGVLAADLKITLDVQVDTEHQKITGVARMASKKTLKSKLDLKNVSRLQLDGKAIALAGESLNVDIPSGTERVLSFETIFTSPKQNYIDAQHVFLTGNWFPKPEDLAEYALAVTLPKGFLAVSEADSVIMRENEETDTFQFQFDHPVDGLSLAASRNYVLKEDQYKDIALKAYFFKEDAHLAEDYLAFTKKYLAMYEKMLTPYPYRRFVIAENLFPTGYSMPTYTLLGKTVVRLPFITRTSLGHEVLHQWFGNSVYIDYAKGNWAEGIANYLADHYYAELKDEGRTYRKQILVNYDAYVNDTTKMPLAHFYARNNKAESAIGYGRGAMIFHELRRMVGDKVFFDGFRDFLETHQFQKASWVDIQKSFEKVNQTDLTSFFLPRLSRDDIPRLTIEASELLVEQGRLTAQFDIVQSDNPYHLRVPVTVITPSAKTDHIVEVSQARESVRLDLDEVPVRVVVDENYDLMRGLDATESPSVLAKIMGKEKLLVVGAPDQAEKYQPVIHALGVKNLIFQTPEKVTLNEINKHSILFAGYQLSTVNMIFGRQPQYLDGVRLKVHENPYNPNEAIMLLHVESVSEAEAIRRKLPHYGKYDTLVFNEGKLVLKKKSETSAGIPVLTRPVVKAIRPDKISTLEDILPTLNSRRIVYVGEQHEKYAHHMNQLMIIKKLHAMGVKLAVGMEMFQTPYQAALDDYMAGRSDERTFLKTSSYFDKWRFDYNLYKPIIDFLKKEKIPLVALNIDGDISRKVARKGINGLTKKEYDQIPPEMDFTDSRYRRDLFEIFGLHDNQHQLSEFNYFLQAQVLWDETMAESVHRYLANHPDTSMIVLAGNGHLRNKYGIPKRVNRRNGLPHTVIVQDENLRSGIADFVLQTSPLKGKKAPLLGVSIEVKDESVHVVGVIEKSPAGEAGLKKGDTIIQVAGQKIHSLADLKYALFYTSSGDTFTIEIDRKGEKISKALTLFDFKHG